jgi:hypothetical protein
MCPTANAQMISFDEGGKLVDREKLNQSAGEKQPKKHIE